MYGDDGWLVHTNHYLSPKMQALEEPAPYSSSRVRLNRTRRLLRTQLGQVSVESLQAILRDHVNWPNSICGHEDMADPSHERALTLVSLIMDFTERVMWAALGPPCEGEYVAYRLNGGSQPPGITGGQSGITPR
jgi:isopenicillin-N N-acyltransferase-like protein